MYSEKCSTKLMLVLLAALAALAQAGGNGDTVVFGMRGKGNVIKHESKGDLIIMGYKSNGGDVIQHNGKKGDLVLMSDHSDDHDDHYEHNDHEDHEHETYEHHEYHDDDHYGYDHHDDDHYEEHYDDDHYDD